MGQKGRKKLEHGETGRLKPDPSIRRRKKKVLLGALVAVLLIAGGIGVWQWNGAGAAPEPAPRFKLKASNGQVISLDDYVGKQEVVLLFYMVAT